MKCQILFSWRGVGGGGGGGNMLNNIINLSSAEFAHKVLKVEYSRTSLNDGSL